MGLFNIAEISFGARSAFILKVVFGNTFEQRGLDSGALTDAKWRETKLLQCLGQRFYL